MDHVIDTFLQRAEALILNAFGDSVAIRCDKSSNGDTCLHQVVLPSNHRLNGLFLYIVRRKPSATLRPYFEVLYANGINVVHYFSNVEECEIACVNALATIEEEIAKWPIGTLHFRKRLQDHANALKAALESSIEHIKLDTTASTGVIFDQLKVVTDHLLTLPYTDEFYDAEANYEKAESTRVQP